MPFALEALSQGLCLADKYDPASLAAGTYYTNGISLAKFRRVMYECQVGAIGSGTITFNLQSSPTSGFGTVHTMTGGGSNTISASNQRVILETQADTVAQQNSGDAYVRLQIVVATSAVVAGATGWAGEATEKPASNSNITAVAQVLAI